MNPLWQFGSSILNGLGAIIFGIPLLILGGAILFSVFTPDKNSLDVHETGEDCSIGKRATGEMLKITRRENGVESVKLQCQLYFTTFETTKSSYGESPSCKPKNATRDGILSDMRKPGEIGLTNTRVPICMYFLHDHEIPKRASFFPE